MLERGNRREMARNGIARDPNDDISESPLGIVSYDATVGCEKG